jgi:adenylate cyclase
MKGQFTKASSSFQKAISHQLELMLANPIFNATPKRVAILKYFVNQTLAGKGRDIKDDMEAVEVFDRGQDFDQTVDPIVKIQTDIRRE